MTSNKKGSSVKEAMVNAVQQLASAITIPHAVKPTNEVAEKSASPSRLIDGRSKCYRQLAELKKNLQDSGIISENEFKDE